MTGTALPILGREEMAALDVDPGEVLETVESALRGIDDPGTDCPRKLAVSGPDSVSYAMLARVGGEGLVGFKTSYTHWTDGPRGRTKQYATSLLLCDETDGRPLAWMDAGRVGALRTSAVTALLARHACAPDTRTAMVVGSGAQGRGTVAALAEVLPSLRRILVVGSHADGLRRCLAAAAAAGLEAEPVEPAEATAAAGNAGLIVGAAGPGTEVDLGSADLSRGTTVIIVGHGVGATCVRDADVLVATSREQMRLTGTDLADADGTLREPDLEFPEALRDGRPVRTSDDQLICCYNSGLVVTDVAVGALLARRALATGTAQEVRMW